MPRTDAGMALSVLLVLFTTGTWAQSPQLQGENLLQATPPNYKLATSGRNGNVLFDEMIPESEQIDRWTEMLTTQIFMGGINADHPEALYRRIDAAWHKACPAARGELIQSGKENGYRVAVWMAACPENPASGEPEYTWYKAIEGNDSFYLIQKSWRYRPTEKEIRRWTHYLGTVAVCDSRLPARSCAALTR